jgi:hypothetical protein
MKRLGNKQPVGPRPGQAGAQSFIKPWQVAATDHGGLLTTCGKPGISRIGEGGSCAVLTAAITAGHVLCSRRGGEGPGRGNRPGRIARISTAIIRPRSLFHPAMSRSWRQCLSATPASSSEIIVTHYTPSQGRNKPQ